jgi:hypothetical protein
VDRRGQGDYDRSKRRWRGRWCNRVMEKHAMIGGEREGAAWYKDKGHEGEEMTKYTKNGTRQGGKTGDRTWMLRVKARKHRGRSSSK